LLAYKRFETYVYFAYIVLVGMTFTTIFRPYDMYFSLYYRQNIAQIAYINQSASLPRHNVLTTTTMSYVIKDGVDFTARKET